MDFQRDRGHRIGPTTTALAVCLLFCVCAGEGTTYGAVKSAPDVVIYDGTYPGWPSITSTPSGKLLCVWREGTQHEYSSVGKVMLGSSVDGGHTWSTPVTVQDEPNIDDRNTSILAISENNWIVAYDTYYPYTSSTHQAMTTYTTDGGACWSTPVAVASSYPINGTRGAPIKLSSGELLLPFSRGPKALHQSLAAISSDNGQTWTTYEVPNGPGCNGNEWSVAEMPNGILAGVIRSSADGSDGSLFLTKSTDMGRTWSTPMKTNLRDTYAFSPGHIFMHNGKPWVLYDDERYVSVALATTDDPDLIDWDVDGQIEAYQYRPDGNRIDDGGYPWSVSVGGNERLIVDYYINGGTHQIVGYYVTMPIPEPGTLAMLAAAAIGALAYAWRKRR